MTRLSSYIVIVLGVAAVAYASTSLGRPAGNAPLTVDEQVAAYQTLADSIRHEQDEYAQDAIQVGKPEEIAVFVAGSDSEIDALIGSININVSHFDAVHELYLVYGGKHNRLFTQSEVLKEFAPEVGRLDAQRLADADQAHSLWQEILSYAHEAKSLGDEDNERREMIFGHMNDDNRTSRKLEADMESITSQIDGIMGQASRKLRELIRAGNSLPASAGMQELPDVDGITFQTTHVNGRGSLKTEAGVTDLATVAPGTHVDGVAELEMGDVGRAVLHLSDGSQIDLAATTSAQLDYFEFAASGRLKSGTITVTRGTFGWSVGNDQGIAPEMTLIVPQGQMRFKGREFAITVNPDGSGSVEVRSGDMVITPKNLPPASGKHHKHGNGTIQLGTNSRIWFKADGTWGESVQMGL